MVARHNLTVYQGSDYRRAMELRDNLNTLMDLTGYVFRGQVRSKYSDSNAVFSFVFTLRDQTSEAGMVDMLLSAADTALVSVSKISDYIYDVEMVAPTGDVKRIMEGNLKLHPEVTR